MAKNSLFIIIGLFLNVASYSQNAPVTIEEVATKFYNTYAISRQNPNVFFEKRARQWNVRSMTFEGTDMVAGNVYLFFDADSGGYKKLPFNLKADTQYVDFNEFVDSYQISDFHLHKYYGYDGWYDDVIADLSGKKQLSDSSLYSLGRAYSTKANALLSNQFGDALKSEIFNMPMTRNCMTSDQMAKYTSVEAKAIHCFYELEEQNKNFQTIVGNIAIKSANEVMVEYHTFLTYADSFAESFSLPDHLYPDSVIEKAQHVLEKCPRDAILLSLGDNDFYPILYLQHRMGVRKDVYLINEILIGVDRYIYRISQPQFESKPIKLSVSYEKYRDNINDYLMLKDSASSIPFSSVIDSIQSGRRNEYGVLTIPGKEFIIKRTTGKTNRVHDDVIHFKKTNAYLLKNEWVLLDIINNLQGRRLCCQTPLFDALLPLNAYFIQVDDNLYLF